MTYKHSHGYGYGITYYQRRRMLRLRELAEYETFTMEEFRRRIRVASYRAATAHGELCKREESAT